MQLKGKKQVKGRSVAVFDTEGLGIADIVDAMVANGWNFSKLTVSYKTKDGYKTQKDVPPSKAGAVYRKYGFSRWAFEASDGSAFLSGTVDCDKGAAAITSSRGGGVNFFASIAPAKAPDFPDYGNDLFDNSPYMSSQQNGGYPGRQLMQMPPQQQSQQGYGNNNAASAAASALYAEEDEDVIPGISQAQRQQNRVYDRQDTHNQLEQGKKNKHGIYFVFAILEMLCIAPIFFAIFVIIDTIKGRKALEYDYNEAQHYFKEARWLLVAGAIAGIAFLIVMFVKFGHLLPFMPH